MKKGKLVKGLASMGILGALLGGYVSVTPKSTYTPRNAADASQETGIAGALEYYKMLKWGDQTPDPAVVLEVQEQVSQMQGTRSAIQVDWENIGPSDVGGRVRALMYDRNDSSIIYAAGVSGGLFKSTNGGLTWSMTPGQPGNMIITSIAQDDNGHIYAGTGELAFLLIGNSNSGTESSGFLGNGIWKTTDGGQSFSQVLAATVENTFSSYYGIYRLAVSGSTVYAATDKGLIYSNDGGASWNDCSSSDGSIMLPTITKDVKANGNLVVAAVGSVVYRTTTGPNGFERLGQSFSGNRVELAIAPSDNNVIYAATSNNSNTLAKVLRTTDQGNTWTEIGSGGSPLFTPLSNSAYGQGNYNLALGVYPDNPDRILLGGVQLWQWGLTEGWTRIGSELNSPFNPFYVHADKHTFTFHPDYGQNGNATLLIGSDGGVGRSQNGGATFDVINRGFNTTQYYGIDYSSEYEGGFIGGAQDNGSSWVSLQGPNPQKGTRLTGGDGFATAWSKFNPNIMFTSVNEGVVYRSEDKGDNFSSPSGFFSSSMLDANGSPLSNNFYTYFKLWEKVSGGGTVLDNSLFLMALDNELWATRHAVVNTAESGYDWFRVLIGTGDIQTISVSTDGDDVYVGTTSGGLYRLANMNSAVDSISGSTTSSASNVAITNMTLALPGSDIVTGISIHPQFSNRILVSLGEYGGTSDQMVYYCGNTSAASPSFVSKKGNLPAMPAYDVLFEYGNPDRVLIGTEFGVWVTDDITAGLPQWEQCTSGIDAVPVFQLLQKIENINGSPNGDIYAATHGRGVFRTSTFLGINEVKDQLESSLNIYPNPAADVVNVNLDGIEEGMVHADLYDITGRLVRSESGNVATGALSMEVTDLKAGSYVMQVRHSSGAQVSKTVIIK